MNYPAPRHVDASYMKLLAKWMEYYGLKDIDYWPDTPGVFQLSDINNAMVVFRKRTGGGHPQIALIGEFEVEQIQCIATSHHGNLIKFEISRDPFDFLGIIHYPVKAFSAYKLL